MIFDLLTKHWQLSHGQQLWHTSEGVMGSTWAPVCPGGGTFRNEFPLNQPSGALEMVWHGNGRICIKPSLLSPDEHEQLEIKATNSQGCNGSWIYLEFIHHPSRWRDPSHVSVNIFEKYWQKKNRFLWPQNADFCPASETIPFYTTTCKGNVSVMPFQPEKKT